MCVLNSSITLSGNSTFIIWTAALGRIAISKPLGFFCSTLLPSSSEVSSPDSCLLLYSAASSLDFLRLSSFSFSRSVTLSLIFFPSSVKASIAFCLSSLAFFGWPIASNILLWSSIVYGVSGGFWISTDFVGLSLEPLLVSISIPIWEAPTSISFTIIFSQFHNLNSVYNKKGVDVNPFSKFFAFKICMRISHQELLQYQLQW